jgi:polyphosphate kinase 2 (PPK2 family)
MAIFDHSWYGRVLDDRVEKNITEKAWRQAYRDIIEFERMLADDGTTILKFFLHISKKEQKKRFDAIEDDPLESWRVNKEDWKRHKKYRSYVEAIEEMLELTDSEFAPWTIVEASSKWFARRKILETTIAALEERLGPQAPPQAPPDKTAKDAELRAASRAISKEEAHA